MFKLQAYLLSCVSSFILWYLLLMSGNKCTVRYDTTFYCTSVQFNAKKSCLNLQIQKRTVKSDKE